MKLGQAPLKYDPGDQARMRGALERADAQNWKRGSDVSLVNVKLTVDGRNVLTDQASDVTGALGYTPVNKAGDTMTGALTVKTGTAGWGWSVLDPAGGSGNSGFYASFNATGTRIGYTGFWNGSVFTIGATDAATPARVITNGATAMYWGPSQATYFGPNYTSATPANADGAYWNQPSGFHAILHSSGHVSGDSFMALYYNATLIGNVVQNGTTGVSYVTASDKRRKTVVSAYEPGNLFDQIEIWNFTWDTGAAGVGPLAQDLYVVQPGWVVPGDDDPTKTPGDPGFVSWQTEISGPLSAVFAELKALRARVAALEAKVP